MEAQAQQPQQPQSQPQPQPQPQQKFKRSLFSVLTYNIPGAREFVALLFTVLAVFLAAVAVSGFLFIKAIQVGHYAEAVITSKIGYILFAWALVWMTSFYYSMHAAMKISYRVAGPIKRMERLLDEILNGHQDVRIVLRKGDALDGLAKRINKLIDQQTSGALKEQQTSYQQYQQKVNEMKKPPNT